MFYISRSRALGRLSRSPVQERCYEWRKRKREATNQHDYSDAQDTMSTQGYDHDNPNARDGQDSEGMT